MRQLVSILIPCFNAERWIGRAIQSAISQTWGNKEIIVVDDGSTDGSLDVIKRFGANIRWESGPNQGGNRTRNRLLTLSRGEWLQYLDADDYLRPEKIADQMAFLEAHPDAEVICSPTTWEETVNGTVVSVDTAIPEPRDPWVLLASWRLPQTGGTLWRKDALGKVGGWRDDQPCCQEHEVYCRLLAAGARFEFCDSCLAVYCNEDNAARITRRSAGGDWARQRLAILSRVEGHLIRCSELTPQRRQAINDGRHELARTLWHGHRRLALEVDNDIRRSDPSFMPKIAPSSPAAYLAAYRIFGFRAAQHIAAWKRAVFDMGRA